jgi:hypothetical protein
LPVSSVADLKNRQARDLGVLFQLGIEPLQPRNVRACAKTI